MATGNRRPRTLAFLAFVCLALAACSTGGGDADTTKPENTGSDKDSGWLASDDDAAILLAYREEAPLTGTMQISRLRTDQTGWTVKGQTEAISVVIGAKDITVTVGSAPPWLGTIDGDKLTLNVPQDDGSLSPVTFERGSVADYNEAVGTLRDLAAMRNVQDAEAANDAALADEASKASVAYDKAITELGSAGQAASEVGDGSILDSYDSALSDYESAWEQMQDADTALRSADCLDVGFLAGDVDFARGDIDFARGALDFVDSDADAVTKRIDTAIAEVESTYDAAVTAADPAGQPAPAREALDTLAPRVKEAQADLAAKRAAVHQRADEIDSAADALSEQAQGYADSRQC